MLAVAEDDARLFAAVDGPEAAPPVVLLHSIGCDHRMWTEQMPALAEWRTIRPDIRGHGRSDAPAGDYALPRLADDVLRILDALDVERAVVCGLSLGGVIAQALALRAPSRVRGLALANTAARIGAAEAWTQRAALVRAEGLGAVAEMAMARFFSPTFRTEHAADVAAFRNGLLATSPQGYAGCCAVLRDADLTRQIARIAAPTLVIGGALDVSTPPEQTRSLADAIPGATYVELDAAHLSNVERPKAFAAALVKHLESC
ncbi:MAG: 3-oxoadipate enol-lactonase [Phenylobacterium sp.]|uniref:3-oxoadipate enol-lactonase n=1 Tax=Phenylobacterium sp. TaxID=1871053 RepID=UPI0025D22924|nr:3-oxoadipate enol-lactonase [Phenylobacterium sp.]MBI1198640.1 3-oxoadipate enol-lactonase [Phenylobacterium sp.]